MGGDTAVVMNAVPVYGGGAPPPLLLNGCEAGPCPLAALGGDTAVVMNAEYGGGTPPLPLLLLLLPVG